MLFEISQRRFPPWQAPVAGALLLALFGVWDARSLEYPVTVRWLAGHALTGAAIGFLVALCDDPSAAGTLVSRFLALVSPVTALLPIVGLPFNAAAWWANRHHRGLCRTLSRVTLVAAVVWSLTVTALLLLVK